MQPAGVPQDGGLDDVQLRMNAGNKWCIVRVPVFGTQPALPECFRDPNSTESEASMVEWLRVGRFTIQVVWPVDEPEPTTLQVLDDWPPSGDGPTD